MQVPVFVEPVPGNGYRAAALGLSFEGATQEVALSGLDRLLKDRVAAGAQVVTLDVPAAKPPWAEFAGTLRNDPMLPAWKQAMAEYRRKMDEDDSSP